MWVVACRCGAVFKVLWGPAICPECVEIPAGLEHEHELPED